MRSKVLLLVVIPAILLVILSFKECGYGTDTLIPDLSERIIEEPAPEAAIPQLDGKIVTLSDLKGKVVVLYFWATWCGPCIKGFPYIQKVVDDYADNPSVAFYAVNVWERDAEEERLTKVQSYITENGYGIPVLLDSAPEYPTADIFNVSGVPTRIVIDRNGIIRFRDSGFTFPGRITQRILTKQIEMVLNDEMVSMQ